MGMDPGVPGDPVWPFQILNVFLYILFHCILLLFHVHFYSVLSYSCNIFSLLFYFSRVRERGWGGTFHRLPALCTLSFAEPWGDTGGRQSAVPDTSDYRRQAARHMNAITVYAVKLNCLRGKQSCWI